MLKLIIMENSIKRLPFVAADEWLLPVEEEINARYAR